MSTTATAPSWINVDDLVSQELRDAMAEHVGRLRGQLTDLVADAATLHRLATRYDDEMRGMVPDEVWPLVEAMSGYAELDDVATLISVMFMSDDSPSSTPAKVLAERFNVELPWV